MIITNNDKLRKPYAYRVPFLPVWDGFGFESTHFGRIEMSRNRTLYTFVVAKMYAPKEKFGERRHALLRTVYGTKQ